ncbi:DUF2637 domain-containing protein [Streptomyces europaeiscabiei]|uniref:DUF2637 domain-containing protein n=1 Tax=Streptomyces europaeiscabiei TaxID=146819 RepID=UPI0029ACFC2F|nr:DUF2637 domain-containing protein [Streptomyces europaeiscabiei]MDX2766995.1 DUF2637 domain-containing protein [Streptomyces europaeiscabiei]
MKTPNGDHPTLTRLQRRLIVAVTAGVAVIALIGFVGSYAAVAALAEAKGFGWFARAFPIGIDAGILVLLALDLLLTWLRMPLPMLRHTAWLLTVSTIAFNGAAAWPDPLGVGMHAVIPILFVVSVEAARHAVGRIADITADKHMEGVRLVRWLLAPRSTFLLWRRMKLWELRSYDDVIRLEQSRLIERTRLRARYGRRWRSKAPVSAVMALRLTRYGRALAPVSGVLNIEHAPPGSAPPVPELPPAQPAVSREPEPSEPEPTDFETTVHTALRVTASEPRPELAAPVLPPTSTLPTLPDLLVSREPVLSPAEPTTASRAEPSPESDGEPSEPGTDEKEQQITQLASRLRVGEQLTKTTAAQLLGVSPATAGRRLKEAKSRIGDGTGQYL